MSVQPFYFRESGIALGNAEYGIAQLRENPKQYVYHLTATLTALRSIPDYVLEEGNQKYGLFIELDEDLKREFRSKAEAMNNREAIRFIDEYEATYKEMVADPVVKAVLGHKGEWNIFKHRKASRLISVSRMRLNEKDQYELVGEPTSHFMTKNRDAVGILPSEQNVPDTLAYCLNKLATFRGHLACALD